MPGKHVRFAGDEVYPSPSWSTTTMTSSPSVGTPPSLPHKLSPYGSSPLPPIEPELEPYVVLHDALQYNTAPRHYFNVAHAPEPALQRMGPALQKEPATYPPVTRLKLVNGALPWAITVTPRSPKPDAYVTVADVVIAIAEGLRRRTEESEYLHETAARQQLISAAWRTRCDEERQNDRHVRRVDWLGGMHAFKGLTETKQQGVWAFHVEVR